MATERDINWWVDFIKEEEKQQGRISLTKNETKDLMLLLGDVKEASDKVDESVKKAVKRSLKQGLNVSLLSAFGEFSMVAKDSDKFVSISADSNRVYLAHNKANTRMVRICIKYLEVLYKELERHKNCGD